VGRDRVIRALLRERFVVTLTTGETFEGIVLDADASTIRLVQAFAISDNDKVPVDGQLFLPREHVAYMQSGVSV
jgi:hypothetical protein